MIHLNLPILLNPQRNLEIIPQLRNIPLNLLNPCLLEVPPALGEQVDGELGRGRAGDAVFEGLCRCGGAGRGGGGAGGGFGGGLDGRAGGEEACESCGAGKGERAEEGHVCRWAKGCECHCEYPKNE